MSQLEQRTNIKFCQKLGKTATETFQMMKLVYGDEALNSSVVFRRHRRSFFARKRQFKSAFTHIGFDGAGAGSGAGCSVIKLSLSHVVRSGRNAGAGSDVRKCSRRRSRHADVGTAAGLSVTMFLNEPFHTQVKSCR